MNLSAKDLVVGKCYFCFIEDESYRPFILLEKPIPEILYGIKDVYNLKVLVDMEIRKCFFPLDSRFKELK